MSAGDTPVRRSGIGLLIRSLFALAALALLLWLGFWQLERKAWKEGLIDTLGARLAALPGDVPPRDAWDKLDPGTEEFRRVAFSGEFLPQQPALVYTNGSAFRRDISGPGYWVMAPMRLLGGSVVVVNRGFVPEGQQSEVAREGEAGGVTDVVGVMRWPEPRSLFTPKDQPERNLFFARDQNDIASAKRWGRIAPFFVELESPQPASGLPRAGKLTINLRNQHLGYALTWFGLAGALVAVFMVWLWRERRGTSPSPGGGGSSA